MGSVIWDYFPTIAVRNSRHVHHKGNCKTAAPWLSDRFSKKVALPQKALVEHIGSGIPRILKRYDRSIFNFTTNFLRVAFPFPESIIERNEVPEKTHHPDSTTGDRPAITGDRPAITGDKPAITGDKPAITDDRPATTGDKPAITDDRPATTGDRKCELSKNH